MIHRDQILRERDAFIRAYVAATGCTARVARAIARLLADRAVTLQYTSKTLSTQTTLELLHAFVISKAAQSQFTTDALLIMLPENLADIAVMKLSQETGKRYELSPQETLALRGSCISLTRN